MDKKWTTKFGKNINEQKIKEIEERMIINAEGRVSLARIGFCWKSLFLIKEIIIE